MARLILGDRIVSPEALEARVLRAAGLLASRGIGSGDVVAYMLRNDIPIFEITQAAQRLGATPLPVNWHFGPAELDHILRDSGAKLLLIHADLLHRLGGGVAPCPLIVAATPAEVAAAFGIPATKCAIPHGSADWERDVAQSAPYAGPLQPGGGTLLYTSGTTGKPKGVRRPAPTAEEAPGMAKVMRRIFGTRPGQVMLAAAPLYHAAPNANANAAAKVDGTIAILPRFEPEAVLAAIERHRVTHMFMVPVMFQRLLKLPEPVRKRYDTSSLEWVMHGAAPCPPEVKRAMIAWWGPVIHEYYGASELGAIAACSSEEWLARPGTVGKAIEGAVIAIYDEAGTRLGPGQTGEIYCRQTLYPDFTYHKLADKRAEVGRDGLVTCGDVGHLDADGYLFISDRKRDMVISGGVNIYPAEIEATLAAMPGVADCAVFGIPDEEFGEALCACIQPESGAALTADAAIGFLRTRLAGYKVPRRIEFHAQLPREESGKIFKRKLRDPYWERAGRRI